jgi:hypothetical protein
MTEDDTGWGDPPAVAQPQDGLGSQPDSLSIRDRPAVSQTYLIGTACLAGILVSAGLAVAEIADYPNGVGYLTILGMITGATGGLAAVAANEKKPRGWVYRINVAAAWLALFSVVTLVVFFTGQHGWYGGGP